MQIFFFYISLYSFLLNLQIYSNNKVERDNTDDTTKHVLVFLFLKKGILNID